MSWSPYLEDIEISSRRVMTLLNRNDFEESSGCFDRSYWHFKTRDYPSAIYQMGVAILAKLWKLEGSEYYKSETVLGHIESSIYFLKKIQKTDGSFDEWYVNERGWGGPTGYLMNACLDTYEIVGNDINEDCKHTLEKIIKKGINFLALSTEGHMLANHVAIVILPLVQAKHLLGLNVHEKIDFLVSQLESSWIESEGWSVEYDGADPGYQSGTLSFLCKTLKYEENEKIKKICVKSLDFISYFTYPSGYCAGAIGSRHTTNFFAAGIEFFRDTGIGARLSTFIEENIKKKTVVLSSDLDDHYLFYRLFEFLDAHYFYIEKNKNSRESSLPYEGTDFLKEFKDAGIKCGKVKDKYWVCSYRRGGAIRVENITSGKVEFVDNGILLKSGKKVYTSLWQDSGVIKDGKIIGSLVDVTPKLFTPTKQILFRVIMLFLGFHHKSALYLKDIIRKILIFNVKNNRYPYERIINISDTDIRIHTKLLVNNNEEVRVGGEFWSRYVPQSRHYQSEQLKTLSPYLKKQANINHEEIYRF